MPSVIRAMANATSSPDGSAIRSASSISRIARSSGLSTPKNISRQENVANAVVEVDHQTASPMGLD
jgi:hypothetical protein